MPHLPIRVAEDVGKEKKYAGEYLHTFNAPLPPCSPAKGMMRMGPMVYHPLIFSAVPNEETVLNPVLLSSSCVLMGESSQNSAAET